MEKQARVILFLEPPGRNAACQHLDFSQEDLGYIIVVLICISLLANDTIDILKEEKEMMQPLPPFCYLFSITYYKNDVVVGLLNKGKVTDYRSICKRYSSVSLLPSSLNLAVMI